VGDGNVAKGTSHCSVFKQKLFSQKKMMAAQGRPVLCNSGTPVLHSRFPGIAGRAQRGI